MGTVARMMAQITSEITAVMPRNHSVSTGLMVSAIRMAPMTIKGDRSKSRSVMFRPFCTWLTSLVMRVTSVGVPIRSSSVWLRVLMWANRSRRSAVPKPKADLAAKYWAVRLLAMPTTAKSTSRPHCRQIKGRSAFWMPSSTIRATTRGTSSSKQASSILNSGAMTVSFSYPLR